MSTGGSASSSSPTTSPWGARPTGSSACSTALSARSNIWRCPMYSRVTLLDVDTLRTDVDEVLEQFKDGVMPRGREVPGYDGGVVLLTPEGKGVTGGCGEGEKPADASAGLAASLVEEFVTIYRSPAGREH